MLKSSASVWAARDAPGLLQLSSTALVLFGGYSYAQNTRLNDVWSSSDNGASFVAMANAPWAGRNVMAWTSPNPNTLVVMGGYTTVRVNDVWSCAFSSTCTWTALSAAPWSPRGYMTAASTAAGSIWLAGGSTATAVLNDFWYSSNSGASW